MLVKATDLHWTAGFVDGDGCFTLAGKSPRIQAGQVQRAPLDRLVRLWGGTICLRKSYQRSKASHTWVVGGHTAVALMMMLYDLMSPPRQLQIERVLRQWKRNGSLNGEHFYNATLSDVEAIEAMRRVFNGEHVTFVAKSVGISHATLSTWLQGARRSYLLQRMRNENEYIVNTKQKSNSPAFDQAENYSELLCHIQWTAGFLEAEGHFSDFSKSSRIIGTQVDMFPLNKLAALWGGNIYVRKATAHHNVIHTWQLNGTKAAALMMTLYPLMSPHRQAQISLPLEAWRNRGGQRGESHPGATIHDADALEAMRHVRDGRSVELVAESLGVTRHTVSLWMRGEKRPYLLEQLNAEEQPNHWRYNGGRQRRRSFPDAQALEAIRRVRNGESQASVARDLGVLDVVIFNWVKGKNRPHLLAQLLQEEREKEAPDGPGD